MVKVKDPDSGPAAQFLQLAAEMPGEARQLVLWAIQNLIDRAETRTGAFDALITFNAHLPGDGCCIKLELLIEAASTMLVNDIAIAADRDLRVEPRYVVSRALAQARFVVFIGERIVAQLFCTRDGRKLRLDVEELPNAKDLGNDVIALEELPFKVHTPLGVA
jgi:hypothetical protein